MGFLDTAKGWFNIGGVKLKLEGIGPTVPKRGNSLSGKAVLTTKSDKQVQKMAYKFMLKKTSGSGDDRHSHEYTLGQSSLDTPFEIKAGETKTLDFSINYTIEETLKDKGGVLGAVGKLAAFASQESLEYYVEAECSVKGTALNPSAKVQVKVAD